MTDPAAGAVVIGCSMGGIRALSALFADLSPLIRRPVLVVCHFRQDDVSGLCEVLARKSALPVIEACERVHPRPGTIHVAPGNYHLHTEMDGRFALSVDPRDCFSRPSINLLFESASWTYGEKLIGIILTGANDDGARGLHSIRQRRGISIVQNPEEAEAPEMPTAALAVAGADFTLPLAEIGGAVNALCLQS